MGKGKHKGGICMADGGITRQETADEVMARMTAKYGAPAAGPVPQQPAPVAQTQPQPKPSPSQPASSGQGILGILRGRKEAIDKAVGGYANGGIVRGIGTPTSDDVPVKIKGKTTTCRIPKLCCHRRLARRSAKCLAPSLAT